MHNPGETAGQAVQEQDTQFAGEAGADKMDLDNKGLDDAEYVGAVGPLVVVCAAVLFRNAMELTLLFRSAQRSMQNSYARDYAVSASARIQKSLLPSVIAGRFLSV